MRTAIVLPLGMLLEKVEINIFIGTMLKKAKEANAEFVFTAQIQQQAFGLAQLYNLNGKSTDDFRTELLKLLGIEGLDAQEFLTEWNKMLTVGDIAKKISDLQTLAARHEFTVYLASDTNIEHLKKIKEQCPDLLSIDGDAKKLAEFPLYASCYLRKNRIALLEHIVVNIKDQQSNKADVIRVISGDPKNIQDGVVRGYAEKDCNAIQEWAAHNGVQVNLHDKTVSLADTLEQIFNPTVQYSRALAM
jgi:hypothetical protein